MKFTQLAASAVAGIIFLPTVASAGPLLHQLNHQDRRIYSGVKNGSLTYKETHRLETREAAIRAQRIQYIKSGGRLTASEALRLDHELDRQSHNIYQQKHD